MNTHYEQPGTKRRHNWQQLYEELDRLPIGSQVVIHLSDRAFVSKARQAVYRYYDSLRLGRPDLDFVYETRAENERLIVSKVKAY
jgi:hypothetical protein